MCVGQRGGGHGHITEYAGHIIHQITWHTELGGERWKIWRCQYESTMCAAAPGLHMHRFCATKNTTSICEILYYLIYINIDFIYVAFIHKIKCNWVCMYACIYIWYIFKKRSCYCAKPCLAPNENQAQWKVAQMYVLHVLTYFHI